MNGVSLIPALPPKVFAYGFSFRKRNLVRRFLGNTQVKFIHNVSNLTTGDTLLLWGSTPAPANLARDVQLIRMEDGFLRSVGLGADLVQPISLVIDKRGIYYDASKPSDLEYLLQHTEFSHALLERAAILRQLIVSSGLTKYNVGSTAWQRPPSANHIILVVGQVESDASIRYGTQSIAGNMALLQTVRQTYPDAYIVYKPHPDVVAGLRLAGKQENEAQQWCNEVVIDVPMGELLSAVDAIHVLTSLAGFEALLRGKSVTCYGQPFYAGWGLTNDQSSINRRTRCLSLDALVAGALILYPIYISKNKKNSFITPEQALDELSNWRSIRSHKLSLWQRGLRMILQITNKH